MPISRESLSGRLPICCAGRIARRNVRESYRAGLHGKAGHGLRLVFQDGIDHRPHAAVDAVPRVFVVLVLWKARHLNGAAAPVVGNKFVKVGKIIAIAIR